MPSKFKPSPAIVLAFMALLVALGGSSFAAPARDAAAKLVTGQQIKNSSLTGADVKNRSLAPVDFKKGSLPRGKTGPRGPAGANGLNGRNGQDAVSLYAQVASNGALVRGKGATGARKQNGGSSAGQYEVDFNRNIDGCSYLASHVSDLSSPVPGGIATNGPLTAMDPKNRIYVGTRNGTGALTDAPFTVAVVC